MISKTKIRKRTKRKRNPELIETIELAKKNNLLDLGKKLSGPLSRYKSINLNELNNLKGDKLLIVGKVLGSGDINKNKTIIALSFSKNAKEKLKKAGCKLRTIKQEIEENTKLNKVEII